MFVIRAWTIFTNWYVVSNKKKSAEDKQSKVSSLLFRPKSCLTLWPHELQHTRLPSTSPSPRVCSNHIYWVSDDIQPPHPLSPYSLALNLSQQSKVCSMCFRTFLNQSRFLYLLLSSSSSSSVQSLSCVWLFVTSWTAALQPSLSITNSRSSPKPISIESVMPSNHLILCHPLILLPSIFPSIRVF